MPTRQPADTVNTTSNMQVAATLPCPAGENHSCSGSEQQQVSHSEICRTFPLPDDFAAKVQASPPLGTLVSTADSYAPISLRIEARLTTWGRNSGCTLVHPDINDVRIATTALGFRFDAPGIDKAIAAGIDWTTLPKLHVLVKNFAKARPIWVNNVRLVGKNADGDDLCGRLHSGDIITMFRPGEAHVSGGSSSKKDTETLKFLCNFSIGEAKEPRREPFSIITMRIKNSRKHKDGKSNKDLME